MGMFLLVCVCVVCSVFFFSLYFLFLYDSSNLLTQWLRYYFHAPPSLSNRRELVRPLTPQLLRTPLPPHDGLDVGAQALEAHGDRGSLGDQDVTLRAEVAPRRVQGLGGLGGLQAHLLGPRLVAAQDDGEFLLGGGRGACQVGEVGGDGLFSVLVRI